MLASNVALAAETTAVAAPALASRVTHYAVSYTVNADGSYRETRAWSLAVLQQGAVNDAKGTVVSYDPSVQKVAINAAYTLKADGRRLKVMKAGLADTPDPATGLNNLAVHFPEVSVGDTVVLTYQVSTRKPMFAKQFSLHETFPRSDVYDDVTIRVDVPTTLWTQDQARDFREVKRLEQGGRKVVEWAWQNPQPGKVMPASLSGYEGEGDAGVLLSTFRTPTDLAQAYVGPAQAKARVTAKVQQQADQIVADQNAREPREVARALYNWVTLNIAHAGTCLRLSSVVPHSAEAVLQKRTGDCKDHATLLQALLQAKGISSTQALINSGHFYGQPKVPVSTMVNHVINHVPSLGLYLDTTSGSTPFGMLPFDDEDKPVALIDDALAGAKTPKSPVGFNRQIMKTDVVVAPDGSATGQVDVALQGMFAVNARLRLKQLTQAKAASLVKGFFEASGQVATGSLVKDDARALKDTYGYRAQFKVQQWLKLPGPGSFVITPLFYSESPVADYLGMASQPASEAETPCASGHSEEEYRYQLPANLTLDRVPEDVKLDSDKLSYSATYQFKDQVLTVKRVFDDRTVGNVCSPASVKAYQAFAAKAVPDSTAPVVFK